MKTERRQQPRYRIAQSFPLQIRRNDRWETVPVDVEDVNREAVCLHIPENFSFGDEMRLGLGSQTQPLELTLRLKQFRPQSRQAFKPFAGEETPRLQAVFNIHWDGDTALLEDYLRHFELLQLPAPQTDNDPSPPALPFPFKCADIKTPLTRRTYGPGRREGMAIKGIGASLPSRKVSNDDVIDLIRFHSTDYAGDLVKDTSIIKSMLERSGLVSRFWCAPYESPLDHLAMAVTQAMAESYLRPEQIELVIYVGIGRGFMEPANSYVVAQALGFHNAECFDVIDACMSWARALWMVKHFFKTGQYKNALIINAEFNMADGGPLYPKNFALREKSQLQYLVPGFTVGEAASATLLMPTDRDDDNCQFIFHAVPDWADFSTIRKSGYEGFCHATDKMIPQLEDQFIAFGAEMHLHGDREVLKLMHKLTIPKEEIDIVFSHASSKAAWHGCGKKAGVAEKIFHIYQDTGNLVSASVPTAMALAHQQGVLQRGKRVVCWVGSAGMSFALISFIF